MKYYIHPHTRATMQVPEKRNKYHHEDISMNFLTSVCNEVDEKQYLRQVEINAIPRQRYHTPVWMMGPEPTKERLKTIMGGKKPVKNGRCRTCGGLNCGLSCVTGDKLVDN